LAVANISADDLGKENIAVEFKVSFSTSREKFWIAVSLALSSNSISLAS